MSSLPDGVWRKIDRAKTHIEALEAEIDEASDGEPRRVGIGRRYDTDAQEIVFYAEKLPEIRDSYGLLVGDAIHNLRCALDHLWWALATLHLGRDPDGDEAKEVQFPIFTKPSFLKPGVWENHAYLRHVSSDAAAKAYPMQPFVTATSKPANTPAYLIDHLALLVTLSNTDKHRFLHTTVAVPERGFIHIPKRFIDCTPKAIAPDGTPGWIVNRFGEDRTIKLNDPVVRIPVVKTGPNREVAMENPRYVCAVSLVLDEGILLRVMDALVNLGKHVIACVREFEPLFEAREAPS
jgi:hypothetical protein